MAAVAAVASPLDRRACAQRPNDPTPGSTTPPPWTAWSGSPTRRRVRRRALEGLLGRAQVAGTSLIEASLEQAPYTTYTTTFTIKAPEPTFP